MYTGIVLEFLNMGGGEIMLILAVVLLLFGGKKLPELARGLGKGIRDFKDASEGVKREIHRNINSLDIDEELNTPTARAEQPAAAAPTLEEQMYPKAEVTSAPEATVKAEPAAPAAPASAPVMPVLTVPANAVPIASAAPVHPVNETPAPSEETPAAQQTKI